MLPIDFFIRAAHRFPDRMAASSPGGDLSFAVLHRRVMALGAAFQDLVPGWLDRVGILGGNSVPHLSALLATLAAGKTWVPLNARAGAAELNSFIDATEPSLLVVDPDQIEKIDARGARVILMTELEALIARFDGQAPAYPLVNLGDTQAIKFTGGTTGMPKGVMQPFRAWNTGIVSQFDAFGFNETDRYLMVAPITHGTSTYVLPVLGGGGCLVFPETSGAGNLLDVMERDRTTMLFAPPTLIYAMIADYEQRPRDLSALRHLIYAAAPMRPERIRAAQKLWGPILATTYGQTEAPQIATFLDGQSLLEDANVASVGRPGLLTQVAILGPDGKQVPAGEAGEVVLRGDLVMTGYWRQPAKTAETIVNGWLHTGDIGLLDERGFLFLKDRSRDVVITGGFNVYPSDVENVLGRHPAVHDCAVLGIEDEKWGEAVTAAVQLRPGLSATAAELTAYIRAALDPVKTPKAVHFFESLPRSAAGKVLKREIRDLILARMKDKP